MSTTERSGVGPARVWLLGTLEAVVWPPALVRVATSAPNWWCGLLCGVVWAFAASACWLARDEVFGNFSSLSEFLFVSFMWSALWGILLAVLITPITLGVSHAVLKRLEARRRQRLAATLRTWLLVGVALVPYIYVGAFARIIVDVERRTFRLIQADQPGWIAWPAWEMLSFALSEPVIIGVGGIVGVCAAGAAARRCPDRSETGCTACGYELQGFAGAVCPECGARRVPEPEVSA